MTATSVSTIVTACPVNPSRLEPGPAAATFPGSLTSGPDAQQRAAGSKPDAPTVLAAQKHAVSSEMIARERAGEPGLMVIKSA